MSANKVFNNLIKTIIYELKEGKFSELDILPKEEDLAKSLNVSRTALRDALKILEQEGYIIRIKKKGTIINKKVLKLNFRLDIEYEFKDLLEIADYDHNFKTLSTKMIEADEKLAEKLGVEKGASLVQVKKIIYANSKPVILCRDYFYLDLFENGQPTKEEYSNDNIFAILEKYSGKRLDFTITDLKPILPDKETKELLQIDEPILAIEEVGFTHNIKPILFSRILWNSQFFNFHIFRKRYL